MKRTAVLILLLSTFFLAGCQTYEYDYYGTIKGIVTDAHDDSPVSNASVLLMPGSVTFTTSSEGEFVFEGLLEGQYTISVQKAGYQANRKVVSVYSGEEVSTSIQLTQIPK